MQSFKYGFADENGKRLQRFFKVIKKESSLWMFS